METFLLRLSPQRRSKLTAFFTYTGRVKQLFNSQQVAPPLSGF